MYVKNLNVNFRNLLILFILILVFLGLVPLLIVNIKLKIIYMDILLPISSSLVAITLFYTVWYSYKNDIATFKSWSLFAAGISIFAVVNTYNFILEDITGSLSLLDYSSIFYLFVYPFLITGALLFLKKPINIRIKSLADMLIVMVSAFFIVWFLFVWPTIGPTQPDTVSDLLSISYLLFDLLLLIVLLVLISNKNRKIQILPVILFSLGVFFQIFGDMIFAYNNVNPSLINHGIYSVLYTSNSLFIIFGVICYLKDIRIDLKNIIRSYKKTRDRYLWISYLPLLLVLSAYSLLLFEPAEKALIFGVGIIVVLVIFREIISLNEIKNAQKTVKSKEFLISKREEQLDFITSNMMDLVTETDVDGAYSFVSPSSKQILGYDPDVLLGKSFFNFVHPEDLESVSEYLQNSTKASESVRMQYRAKNAHNNYIWFETIGKPVYKNNKLRGFIYSSRDITEQKTSEELIRNSLLEKQTLLREIHHRVNNNFQIISSLLNLQSRNVVDPADVDLFIQSKNRVKSMAMIHEKLYQTKNLNSINFSDYIRTLLSGLIYDSNKVSMIDFEIDIGDINLNLETAIPCGLIINEIVSNSIKHAFPEGENGKIWVEMYEKNGYELIIGDDGLGKLTQESFDKSQSLGLNLIKSLVDQLEGEIRILDGKGTIYKLTFQELNYKTRI